MPKKRLDIVGQKFGRAIVQKFSHINTKRQSCWVCLCDCGVTKIIIGSDLVRGVTSSCGCYKREVSRESAIKSGPKRIKNMTGRICGYLTITRRTNKKIGGSYVWECECKCGNVCEVSGSCLRSGNTKSCGCLNKEMSKKLAKNVSKQIFGYLKAINPTKRRDKGRNVIWECECRCGNICEVSLLKLTTGHVTSCGCRIISNLYENTKQILLDLSVEIFQEEYSIPQKFFSLGNKKSTLRLDLLVIYRDKFIAIECQGRQHYEPITYFGGEKGYKAQVERDFLKKQYLQALNIPLIEVRYDEKNIGNFLKTQLDLI